MPQRLPRFYRHQQEIEDERKVAKIILEADGSSEETGTPLRRGADGHDWERRRGLPIIGRENR